MFEAILSLLLTTSLLVGSPGPATLSLAATGAAVGFRRGSQFLLGLMAGLAIVITAAGIGLASLFARFQQLQLLAQVLGAAYIVYLAFKIASSPVLQSGHAESEADPLFRDGFILNLLNVKAYAVFLAIYSGFVLPFENPGVGYASTGLICFCVALMANLTWLWFGSAIRPLFTRPREARILRIAFAVMMVVAVAFVLVD